MGAEWRYTRNYASFTINFLLLPDPSHPVTKTLTTLRIGKYERYYTKGGNGSSGGGPVPLLLRAYGSR